MKKAKYIRRQKKRVNKRKRVPRAFGSTTMISRHAYVTTVTADASLTVYGSLSFALSDLPSYTEFTQLYDEYKIMKVVLSFYPVRATQVYTATLTIPVFICAVDHDDSTAPTNITTLLQYPGCRIKSSRNQFSVTIKPKVASAVYNGVTDAYSAKSQYVDCTYGSVPHYGFKYAIGSAGVASSVSYDIYAKYYVAFRGVR